MQDKSDTHQQSRKINISHDISFLRFTGIRLIFKCEDWTGRVALPAWEQDRDDILKQSMHMS